MEPSHTEHAAAHQPAGAKQPAMVGEYSLFSILAFVLGFVFWPAGLVLGIMALSEFKQHPHMKGKVLAWLGILLPPGVFIGLMLLTFGLALIPALMSV